MNIYIGIGVESLTCCRREGECICREKEVRNILVCLDNYIFLR